jgi:hypothetical protein
MSLYTMSDELLAAHTRELELRLDAANRLYLELKIKLGDANAEYHRRQRHTSSPWDETDPTQDSIDRGYDEPRPEGFLLPPWDEDNGPIDTLEERVE